MARAARAACGSRRAGDARGFRCDARRRPSPTSPPACRPRCGADFIEPLCVAALNTPAREASGAVFLRVLRDALVREPGVGRPAAAAGRPRRACFPAPALAWLERNGATIRLAASRRAHRARRRRLARRRRAASTASSSPPARSRRRGSSAPHAPAWAARAAALALRADRHRLRAQRGLRACREPMLALRATTPTGRRSSSSTAASSAREAGLLAFVISGASRLGRARHRRPPRPATLAQASARAGRATCARRSRSCGRSSRSARPSPARPASPGRRWQSPRACSPCGDYVDGPYPATLEGAVRSGVAAARAGDRPIGREFRA